MNKYLQATIRLFGTPKWAVLKRQRLVYLRLKFPSGKLSPNFRYIEFFTKDGMPIPTRSVAHLVWFCRHILEPMRRKFGPCYITSAYRHYWYNRRIGGASESYHVWDRYSDNTIEGTELAFDLTFARGTEEEWGKEFERLLKIASRGRRGGGIGIYPSVNFTHCDTRYFKARWRG